MKCDKILIKHLTHTEIENSLTPVPATAYMYTFLNYDWRFAAFYIIQLFAG